MIPLTYLSIYILGLNLYAVVVIKFHYCELNEFSLEPKYLTGIDVVTLINSYACITVIYYSETKLQCYFYTTAV